MIKISESKMASVRIFFLLLLMAGMQLKADNGLPKCIDISADALFWYSSETVDWGHVLTSNTNFVNDSYKTICFNWAPGFRVGLGYKTNHDQWDTQLAYTWFQAQATDHSSGPITSGFLAARLSLLEPFGNGDMKSNLHYNMFDWDVGRNYFVNHSLSMRPFIGLKGGWIDQKIDVLWTTPDFIVPGFLFTATENVKNKFLGAGPKIGFNGKYILRNYNNAAFSLISSFQGAFMWGHWTLRDEFNDVFLTRISVPMEDRNFGALMLQASMGFAWDFCLNKNHFTLKVCYEIQDWFNFFQVFTNDSGTDNFDLILQGLTVDVGIDF